GTAGPNTMGTSGSVAYFNGDDAMALVRWTGATAGQGTPVIVDIFGVIGNKPLHPSGNTSLTGFWRSREVVAPGDTIDVRSANQSLVRKPFIENGIRVNPAVASYRIGDEWIPYSDAFDTPNVGDQSYADLGQHTFTGTLGAYNTVASVLEKFNNSITVYPVPAKEVVNIKLENVKDSALNILNSVGQSISAVPAGFDNEIVQVNTSNLKPGLYFIQVVSADKQMVIYKELVIQ
ncbi:MAG: T9SS type A sorting domain-containing protein, partial [Hymenobacteraceae bacterium]|nr:T9SS type A sorting domain-containing protein [Hymenobacteraceae bacterium]MDX5397146.1 T9SS type A sorting domain-containing protein [Hymenobacteraceae bacterium]MDX5513224.1 T9SS type A sorting domain-containing protein [Hymenobacteraceae bacterium]